MQTIEQIVRHAKSVVRQKPSRETCDAVRRYTDRFDACTSSPCDGGTDFFTFHVDVPAICRVIDYIDVKHDHGAFDYGKLAAHLVWSASIFNPGARIFFVTDMSGRAPPDQTNLNIIRLPVNTAAPMFERVKAMAGYVGSRAFVRNTVFLDTDAFPNRALEPIFNHAFDVGVTCRNSTGFMPLNEGVIFCSVRNSAAVRAFFSAYLGTYESLMSDSTIKSYYGDIQRWRGGQLSLSALASPPDDAAPTENFYANGALIKAFPCNDYNYWIRRAILKSQKSLDRKFVLHLKGESKMHVESLMEYQLKRAQRANIHRETPLFQIPS